MTLRQSDLVVVSNRLPIDVSRGPDGELTYGRSPGGLVAALDPVLRSSGGTWVGWPGAPDLSFEPVEVDGVVAAPLELTAKELAYYYEGFSNATLWPLYHDVIEAPEYHREWHECYREVNQRFARRAADAVAPGGTVWVHDYQLQLAPAMIRDLRPDVRIGFFNHIPFPPEA
ncbi:MAG: trehalose-6-phosphate synthase, partial [Bifidobacteriaceae bacterium]|nr:trehalose-6-phosphate synthase [Bifidobacteriaceae bacterium]